MPRNALPTSNTGIPLYSLKPGQTRAQYLRDNCKQKAVVVWWLRFYPFCLTFWFILGSGLCCYSRLLNKSKLQCEVGLYHGLLVHSDFLTCLNRAYLFRNSANLLFADQDNKIYNSSQTLYATIYALAVHYSSCLYRYSSLWLCYLPPSKFNCCLYLPQFHVIIKLCNNIYCIMSL